MRYCILLLLSIFNALSLTSLFSADLTRQKPITKIVELLGKTGEYHSFKPSIIYFKTGKLYKLILRNNSDSKHYFSSLSFSSSIFTRKIQISTEKGVISEVKGIIKEVEVWPKNQVEWWFVPVKTGQFNDLFCSVEDKITEKIHKDMGMLGTIIIE